MTEPSNPENLQAPFDAPPRRDGGLDGVYVPGDDKPSPRKSGWRWQVELAGSGERIEVVKAELSSGVTVVTAADGTRYASLPESDKVVPVAELDPSLTMAEAAIRWTPRADIEPVEHIEPEEWRGWDVILAGTNQRISVRPLALDPPDVSFLESVDGERFVALLEPGGTVVRLADLDALPGNNSVRVKRDSFIPPAQPPPEPVEEEPLTTIASLKWPPPKREGDEDEDE